MLLLLQRLVLQPQQRAQRLGAVLARGLHAASPAQQDAGSEGAAGADYDSFYDSTVEQFASQPVEVLSLYQMLHYGRNAHEDPDKIMRSARYVQRELPKRLARRLMDLQLLPHIVVMNPHIRMVYKNLHDSFQTLRALPPVRTLEENRRLVVLLQQQLDQHAPMLDELAQGLRECKSKQLVGPALQLDSFFDSMLRSRISRRLLSEQHLHLAEKRPGYVGVINVDLDVAESVNFAAAKTKQMCTEVYGCAPEILVTGDTTARMPYVSAHLDYALFELLKNAARAVVEHHRDRPRLPRQAPPVAGGSSLASTLPPPFTPLSLPPITVRICAGHSTDLTIKITDMGGGVPAHLTQQIWSYGFSTVHNGTSPKQGSAGPHVPHALQGSAFDNSQVLQLPTGHAAAGARTSFWHSYSPKFASLQPAWRARDAGAGPELQPSSSSSSSESQQQQHPLDLMSGGGGAAGLGTQQMAGLGFGLPMSRLYARFFGGDLCLQVVPNYGVDAYLTLRRLDEASGWNEGV